MKIYVWSIPSYRSKTQITGFLTLGTEGCWKYHGRIKSQIRTHWEELEGNHDYTIRKIKWTFVNAETTKVIIKNVMNKAELKHSIINSEFTSNSIY